MIDPDLNPIESKNLKPKNPVRNDNKKIIRWPGIDKSKKDEIIDFLSKNGGWEQCDLIGNLGLGNIIDSSTFSVK